MLTVMATKGFAYYNNAPIYDMVNTANKIIPKGEFITNLKDGLFVMSHKGKVYTCLIVDTMPMRIGCEQNQNPDI